MIATTKATHGMLVEVLNYSVYQDSGEDESNDEGNDETDAKPKREQRQPNNINKNVKNDKNEQEKELKNLPLRKTLNAFIPRMTESINWLNDFMNWPMRMLSNLGQAI